MKRREFMILLSGTVSWPLAARGQQVAKLPTIGVLGPTTASVARPWTAALVQRLGELGWIEGRTLAIEYRWAEGRTERAAEIAAEFVRLKVDVMVTAGTANVIAAKQVTSVIPIVFASAGDPVGTGLVASLARPGGNVTGLSNQSTDLAAKRIELLREVVPGLRRLAIMTYGGPIAMLEAGEAHAAALTLGLEAVTLEIRQADDITTAFEMLRGRAEALHLASGQLLKAPNQQLGFGRASADDAHLSGAGRIWGPDVLWTEFPAHVPAWPQTTSTRFYAGRSQPTSRSSSRQSSSWLST